MPSIEFAQEKQATPADLQNAFERLLSAEGELLASGPTERAEGTGTTRGIRFRLTDRLGSNPEDSPVYSLTKGLEDSYGPAAYYWGERIPQTGAYSEKKIRIENGKARFSEYLYKWSDETGWEAENSNSDDTTTLSEKALRRIHSIVTNPTVKRAPNAVLDYYRDRHTQRSRVGQMVARITRADRPKHL